MSSAAPPKLKGHFLYGHLREFLNSAPRLYMSAFEQRPSDEVVHLRVGYYPRVYLIRHPDDIERVLETNVDNYPKAAYHLLEPLIGNGLLRNEGPTFKQQKRLMQPPLRGHHLAALAPTMCDVVSNTISDWKQRIAVGDRIFDIEEEMTNLTVGIVTRTLFGTDLSKNGSQVGQDLRYALRYGIRRLSSIPATIVPNPPTRGNRRYRQSLRRLDAVVYELISNKRAQIRDGLADGGTDDLLTQLISARDEESNESMTDLQLRDEAMTLLTAGHETTAKALSWTFYLLSHHPGAADRIRQEAATTIEGDQPDADIVSYFPGDGQKLDYTRKVLEESMRIFPPVTGLARSVTREDRLGSYVLAPNSYLIISQYAAHRHPAFWDEPELFDPERFNQENSAGRPRYAYLPFGGGVRGCIGNQFAYMEAEIVLAMLLREFELTLVPDQSIDLESTFTLRPRHGLRMSVSTTR